MYRVSPTRPWIKMGDRYTKAERSGRLDRSQEVLYKDAAKLHETFDNIKVVAAVGDTQNPEVMAMMMGELPPHSGSYTVGRPGGGYAEYTSPGDGFGVTYDH